ncbi:MAG TPA: hypothetical protein VGJ32_10215 [Solirubrobacteraceae bacterium]|jgi:hypothetical protein
MSGALMLRNEQGERYAIPLPTMEKFKIPEGKEGHFEELGQTPERGQSVQGFSDDFDWGSWYVVPTVTDYVCVETGDGYYCWEWDD